MNIVKVTTQLEFDALPTKYAEYTRIDLMGVFTICKNIENACYLAWGSSRVEAWGSSSVEAWGSSSVVARDSSRVEAWESSSVEAWESSSVEARGASSVEAWGSSRVEAWGSSSVEAWESSSVEAWESSVTISGLFFWSTLIMHFCVCEVLKKHATAKIVKHVKTKISNAMFCDTLEKVKEGYVLYKSVNPATLCDFHTGKIKYEGTVICPDWDKDVLRECGGGLHLSPTAAAALNYNQGKVLRCAVKPADFVIYQAGDFTKVRCRKVIVLGEAA